jgi:hypothetical protein
MREKNKPLKGKGYGGTIIRKIFRKIWVLILLILDRR